MLIAEKTVPDDIPILNYGDRADASNLVLPKSPLLSSDRWNRWHFEVQRQPVHDTGNHCHQMHIVTMVTSGTTI
ncbi:MAG: hypothetical protein ACRC62_27585, partial [Microcoleus sp.]